MREIKNKTTQTERNQRASTAAVLALTILVISIAVGMVITVVYGC